MKKMKKKQNDLKMKTRITLALIEHCPTPLHLSPQVKTKCCINKLITISLYEYFYLLLIQQQCASSCLYSSVYIDISFSSRAPSISGLSLLISRKTERSLRILIDHEISPHIRAYLSQIFFLSNFDVLSFTTCFMLTKKSCILSTQRRNR